MLLKKRSKVTANSPIDQHPNWEPFDMITMDICGLFQSQIRASTFLWQQITFPNGPNTGTSLTKKPKQFNLIIAWKSSLAVTCVIFRQVACYYPTTKLTWCPHTLFCQDASSLGSNLSRCVIFRQVVSFFMVQWCPIHYLSIYKWLQA